MCRKQLVLLCQILVLLQVLNCSRAVLYEFVMAEEEIFSDCMDNPKGYLNITGLMDFSSTSMEMVEEGIILDGNMTSVWKVYPTDTIKGSFALFYYDRGTWQQTILSMSVGDFCKVMYKENQYWFIHWTQHVTNIEVRDKCLSLGTMLIIERYTFSLKFGLDVPLRSGRYRIVYNLVATDRTGVRRKNGICFEIRGDINRAQ
ncbi:uncharacterized protein DMAD_08955 [Drosophila madeirensis]|uniref:Uncharacterized protein n=1 Tax=Drosophila madeirensis TaxID=30013 RepID=A0AAU9EV76_DROMD